MSYSKLIHDYLDGELGQTQQDLLFAELSNNADARHEFNQQLKLHRITQNDMSVIAPPVATTNAIFSQLGFSIPPGFGSGASTAAGTGLGTAILLFFRKYAGNIITALSGALLTGFIVFYLSNFEPETINRSLQTTNSNQIQLPQVVSSVEPEPAPTQAINANQNGISAADVERMINSAMNRYMSRVDSYYKSYFASLTANNGQQTIAANKDVSASNLPYRPFSNYPYGMLMYIRPDSRESSRIVNNDLSVTPDSQLRNTDIQKEYNPLFNLDVRAYSTKSGIAVDVPSKSNPWFSNMGIGLSYNLSDKHAVGIELGQESFPQAFTRTQNGEVLAQEQNPILPWMGATYKYSMMNFIIPDIFYPYVEVLGGLTKVGPLGRAQIGMQFKPDNRVTFKLGAEGSILWYNVQGKVYDTKKLGLTYGVSIHY